MCARENKSSLPPFWEKRGELYYNSLTCFSAKEIPERVRGGILADDMGLVSHTHMYIFHTYLIAHMLNTLCEEKWWKCCVWPLENLFFFLHSPQQSLHSCDLSRHESILKLLLCVFQGKTLTTIALILTNFHKGKPLPVGKSVSVAVSECVLFNHYSVWVAWVHPCVCLHVCRRSSLYLSKPKLNHRWPPIWEVLSTFTKLAVADLNVHILTCHKTEKQP